jgi:hypothetical protein
LYFHKYLLRLRIDFKVSKVQNKKIGH